MFLLLICHSAKAHMNTLGLSQDAINGYVEAANKSTVDQVAACQYYEIAKRTNPTVPKGSFAYNVLYNLKAGISSY